MQLIVVRNRLAQCNMVRSLLKRRDLFLLQKSPYIFETGEASCSVEILTCKVERLETGYAYLTTADITGQAMYVPYNVTLRCFSVTIVAVEKQLVLHKLCEYLQP